jgi:hypothetical protein
MGRNQAGHAIPPTAVLLRLPEAGRTVRRLGGGLPTIACQPELAHQAQPAGSVMRSVLAGNRRSARITGLRSGDRGPPRHGRCSQQGLEALWHGRSMRPRPVMSVCNGYGRKIPSGLVVLVGSPDQGMRGGARALSNG